jgi:hypothetical protein
MNLVLLIQTISKCILVSKLLIILGFAKPDTVRHAKSECKEGWGQWIVIDE